MKYRIKIIIPKIGSKQYTPQVRRLGIWWNVRYNGTIDIPFNAMLLSEKAAMDFINQHRLKNDLAKGKDSKLIAMLDNDGYLECVRGDR